MLEKDSASAELQIRGGGDRLRNRQSLHFVITEGWNRFKAQRGKDALVSLGVRWQIPWIQTPHVIEATFVCGGWGQSRGVSLYVSESYLIFQNYAWDSLGSLLILWPGLMRELSNHIWNSVTFLTLYMSLDSALICFIIMILSKQNFFVYLLYARYSGH